jgi:hypothetical protein
MMIQIDDMVVSSDILDQYFCCDLTQCHGACCVHGTSGAPVDSGEAELLKQILPKLKPYIKPSGLKAIKTQGTTTIDADHDVVTPLIDGLECAYCIEENDISLCAIEKAWLARKVDFRKPISCHLYPIRVRRYNTFTALNYDQWAICEPARKLGKQKGIAVYQFLREAIVRAFGQEFYNQLDEAAKLLPTEKNR